MDRDLAKKGVVFGLALLGTLAKNTQTNIDDTVVNYLNQNVDLVVDQIMKLFKQANP